MIASPRQVNNHLVRRWLAPFQRFLNIETSSSVVLLAATLAALASANSRFDPIYEKLLDVHFGVRMGSSEISWPMHHWINDALMSVFFLTVGLEVKREFVIGELASLRRALLPVIAALGGILVPVVIYIALNHSGTAARGWGIPIATDIAFSLAILVSFGSRIPLALRIFLASLAIVDDIGGVLVIAVAYTSELHVGMLLMAGAVFMLCLLLNRLGVATLSVYMAAGAVLWCAMHASGIHATLAGVVLALAIPSRTFIGADHFVQEAQTNLGNFSQKVQGLSLIDAEQQSALRRLRCGLELVESPLDRLQSALHPWVSYGIVPLFAFANAGIPFHGFKPASMLEPAFAGVALGLLLGKPIGILTFSWVAVKLRWAELPRGVGWTQLHAVGWLAGIGFTVSIFIAGLAFGEGTDYTQARIAVLVASICAAAVGATLLGIARSSAEPVAP